MVINNINDYCTKLGIAFENLSFTHRSIDPDNYDVCLIDKKLNYLDKLLVKNNKSGKFMEYFFDDLLDTEWIDITNYLLSKHTKLKEIDTNNKYFLNRKYELKRVSDNRIIMKSLSSIKLSNRDEYPRITYSFFDKSGKQYKCHSDIHSLIASIFIPNPKPNEYNIVNHKDKSKLNFQIENLEWCNTHYNNLKDNKQKKSWNNKIVQKSLTGNIIKIWENLEELFKSYSKSTIYKAIREHRVFDNSYWELINTTLENYLAKHPFKSNIWYKNNNIVDYDVQVNENGVLKVNGKLTVGTLNKSKLTYDIKLGTKHYLLHRLIYETISKESLNSEDTIDHIIPVTKEDINNEFSNLRKCSLKENMNNINTINNLNIPCSMYDKNGKFIKTFSSNKAAALAMNCSTSNISSCINGKTITCKGFIWIKENDKDMLKQKLDLLNKKRKR